MATLSTRRVLLTSFFVDLFDIVTNVIVAILSGSAVMAVEAISGIADLCSVFLLLIGNKRSKRRATKLHPFGYGKEQYFWATFAGFIILIISANLSFFFGWHAFTHPEPIGFIWLSIAALALAICTNGYAFRQSARKLLEGRPWRRLPRIFMQSWQTAPKTTLVLDAMGTTSATLGLISLAVYSLTGIQKLDGIGAMIMALALASFAVLLLVGVRSLVIGQSATPAMQKRIKKAALGIPEVRQVPGIQTMILGTETMLANMAVNLQNDLTTDEIEAVVARIRAAVQKAFPEQTVQVNVETVPPAPTKPSSASLPPSRQPDKIIRENK
jgi:cation diffusion facilitator family transporter